jgi:hypothetical protein
MRDEFLWVEKYRPKTIEECILPENIKKTFKDFLNKGEVPNLLLSGPAGCGKTTVAKALCAELGVDSYVINGSDEGRFLDTVRIYPQLSTKCLSYCCLSTPRRSRKKQIRHFTLIKKILKGFLYILGENTFLNSLGSILFDPEKFISHNQPKVESGSSAI